MSLHAGHLFGLGLVTVFAGLCLIGCSSTRDDMSSAAAATTLAPVVAPVVVSYGVAYSANDLGQNSSMTLGVDPEVYSTEIDRQQFAALALRYDVSGIQSAWEYMGTKKGYHYLACYPPLAGLRQIYRIPVSQFQIDKPFALSTTGIGWRNIRAPQLTNIFLNGTNVYLLNPIYATNYQPNCVMDPVVVLYPTNSVMELVLRPALSQTNVHPAQTTNGP